MYSADGLTRLKTLGLDHCSGLTALPDGLGALTRLQTMKFGCSGLTALPSLPAGLRGLTSLPPVQVAPGRNHLQ